MYHSQLRSFHAVAVHGGFSNAARELNLSQPTISDQVRKLEDWFNVRLFERRKRSVVPTELGARLFEITRRMFELENEAVELLSESHALRTGSLRVAADGAPHLVGLVGRFRKAYPGISVSLSVANGDEVFARLLNFEADVVVLAEVPEDERLETFTLRTDPLVAFVSTEHPWASRSGITLRELTTEPIVMRERGSLTRATLEDELQRLGCSYEIAMEADRREVAREAVAAGIGIGVVLRPEFGFDTRLKALELIDCERQLTESLVCLKERLQLRTVAAFWEIATGSGLPEAGEARPVDAASL
ncbi:MAG: LysR substrate-binding domain-containing protein [Hyphomicrobiales bacterium]|nr:LysR substrate-binding domain-containing protein [Hyphomicrobiales bacterium]